MILPLNLLGSAASATNVLLVSVDQFLFANMRRDKYRFQAYWSYIKLHPSHRYLRMKHRRDIPSCVVNYIHGQWPDHQGTYVGFKEPGKAAPDEENAALVPYELEGLLELRTKLGILDVLYICNVGYGY